MQRIQLNLAGVTPGIIRVHRERGMYGTFDCTAMRDMRLSNKAVGCHTRLLDNADTWQVREGPLSRKTEKDGKHSIRTQLQELEHYGYLVRIEVRDERNRFQGIVSYVFERPVDPATLDLPQNCRTLLSKRQSRARDDVDPRPVDAQTDPTPADPTPADPPQAENRIAADRLFFWPSGLRFSESGFSEIGKPQHSKYLVLSQDLKSKLVVRAIPAYPVQPKATDSLLRDQRKKQQRPDQPRTSHGVVPRPADAGGAHAPTATPPHPAQDSTTPPQAEPDQATSLENVPGAARQAVRSRLNQVLGTKREDNQRVPCLPGLLEEAPNGLCRDLWLDTPLEQLEQMIVDARAKHATGKGKFRTLLIARLDALALAALRPPPVATPAPEEESAPQYPTPQPGQTWVDPKGEAVEIVQVQELKRVEKRRGVEVEVSAGTLIHLSTGRKARLGEFMLSHRPSVQP